MLKVLYESDAIADIGKLDYVWNQTETFAFLPDKGGKALEIIADSLSALPKPYRTGHYALSTSGSTGQPKLLLGSRTRSGDLARLLHESQKLDPVNETIVALPLTYCYSFVNQYLWARLHCRRLVVTKGLTRPMELRSALLAADDAMLCLTGAQVRMFIQHFTGSAFPGVIRLNFAGGRFPAEQLDSLRHLFPNALIFNNYGCAEAMPRLTLRTADATLKPNHVGWPLPGVEFASSSDGELLFRSPYGAIGQVDADGFRPFRPTDWVATGDLGWQAEDGHVELTGRISEVFKRYGEKISIPSLLHSVGAAWKGHASFYREVDSSGEHGYVLVVAPHPNKDESRKILSALRKNHPRPHWPLRLESLPELPLLPNGKVDLQGLPEQTDLIQHWRQRA